MTSAREVHPYGSRTLLKRGLVFLLGLALAGTPPAMAWGPAGHRIVSEIAARSLPPSFPGFTRQSGALLNFLSLEPDRWRDRDQPLLRAANSPDHFIEFDNISFLPSLPPDRYRFYQALFERRAQLEAEGRFSQAGELLPERVGLQPYVTAEVYGRLTIAWRQYRRARGAGRPSSGIEQAILFYMGWLSHYVADGAQPLHTTRHSDGWVGRNPRGYSRGPGLHAKVEDDFLNRSGLPAALRARTARARLLSDPFSDYVAYLRASHALVAKLYEMEKEKGFEGPGTPASRRFIADRLTAAAKMLVSLWYTAYQNSASRP